MSKHRVMVVGAVGSGKSTLISALYGGRGEVKKPRP